MQRRISRSQLRKVASGRRRKRQNARRSIGL
jgi:hypothetical protein